MPIYVKRHWNETRGDQYDAWGTSWWYFEVGTDGWVTRQIEQYHSGMQLRYGPEHRDDEFGGLAQAALTLSEPEYVPISHWEFDALWQPLQRRYRPEADLKIVTYFS